MILFIPLLFLLVITVHGDEDINEPKESSNQSPSSQTLPSKKNYVTKITAFEVITPNRTIQYRNSDNPDYMRVNVIDRRWDESALPTNSETNTNNEVNESFLTNLC